MRWGEARGDEGGEVVEATSCLGWGSLVEISDLT